MSKEDEKRLTENEKKHARSLWSYGHTYREITQDTLDRRSYLAYSGILKEVIECVKGIRKK